MSGSDHSVLARERFAREAFGKALTAMSDGDPDRAAELFASGVTLLAPSAEPAASGLAWRRGVAWRVAEAASASALWFTPEAIREHFDGDDSPRADAVRDMSDGDLAKVGARAMWSEFMWRAFGEAVGFEVDELAGEVVPGE